MASSSAKKRKYSENEIPPYAFIPIPDGSYNTTQNHNATITPPRPNSVETVFYYSDEDNDLNVSLISNSISSVKTVFYDSDNDSTWNYIIEHDIHDMNDPDNILAWENEFFDHLNPSVDICPWYCESDHYPDFEHESYLEDNDSEVATYNAMNFDFTADDILTWENEFFDFYNPETRSTIPGLW